MNRTQLKALIQDHPATVAERINAPDRVDTPDLTSAIVIGTSDAGHPVLLDLPKLVAGRLLIQGNSGAGKSMLLRRIFEQAFGRIQQLVVDGEGEFSTLAAAFDVAVLTAADAQRVGPEALAHHIRQHRYSAVLDLSDASAEDRLDIVARLAKGLVEAPQEYWHPMLVLIDEAQSLAPFYDNGDAAPDTRKAAIVAIAELMGRGRKRGLAGVIATARIAETSKAVISKATNAIVGRTIFDRDMERAGSLLGFTAARAAALRSLGDGEFLAIGPAIAGPKRVRFRSGLVKSEHKGRSPDIVAPPMAASATVAALKAEDPASPLAGVLALVVAAQIDIVRGYHTPSAVRAKLEAIRDAISVPVMDGALKKAFNTERYFKNAPKEFVVKAIKEACGDLAAKTMGPRTKASAWHYALEHVVKTSWLPPELRTSHYSGPGAKKPAEKTAAKAPKLKKAA